MNGKSFFGVLALAGMLAGCCAANSKDYVLYYLDKGFDGKPVNRFFVEYGNSDAEFTSPDGWHIYRWTSLQPAVKTSGEPVHVTQYANGEYETIRLHRTGTARSYCELNITTDSEDTIRGFAMAVDSAGLWSASRCSEIFDRTYP